MILYFELQLASQTLLKLLDAGAGGASASLKGREVDGTEGLFVIGQATVHPAALNIAEHADEAIDIHEYTPPVTELISDVPTVKVAQTVDFDLLTATRGADGKVTPTGSGPTVTVTVVRRIWATGVDRDPELYITSDRVEGPTPNVSQPLATALTQAALDAVGGTITSKIAIPDALKQGDSPLLPANAGVAASPGGDRIAVRVQLGNTLASAGPPEWRAFFEGAIDDDITSPGPSRGWTVRLAGKVVAKVAHDIVEQQMARNQDKFKLSGGIGADWVSDHIAIDFSGSAINACVTFRTDIDYTVTGNVSFSVPERGQLQSRTDFNWDGDGLQQLGCEIGTALLGLLVGGVTGAALGGPTGAAIGGAIGGIGVFVASVLAFTAYTPTLHTPPNCSQDGHAVVCTQDIKFPLGVGAPPLTLQPEWSRSDPSGLLVAGLLPLGNLPGFPQMSTKSVEFEWEPPKITCASVAPGFMDGLIKNPALYATAVGQVWVANLGHGQLILESATVVSDDPEAVFRDLRLYPDSQGGIVEIRATFDAAYQAAPYPCRILVVSNAGETIVELAPIPALDKNAVIGKALAMVEGCTVTTNDWWERFHRFDLHWLIDPGDERELWRLWQVELSGVDRGDGFQLEQHGRTVGRAWAGEAGVAQLGLLDRAAGDTVRVTHLENGRRAMPDTLQLKTRMTELVPLALIPAGQTTSVSLVPSAGAMLLTAANASGATVYALRGPSHTAIQFLELAGCRGAHLVDGQLVAWNDSTIAVRDTATGTTARRTFRSVESVQPASAGLTVVADGTTQQLALSSLNDLAQRHSVSVERPTVKTAVRFSPAARSTATKDGYRIADHTDLFAEYTETPWFEQLTWCGKTAVSSADNRLTILAIGRSAVA